MKILNPKYAGSDDEAVEAVVSRLKSDGKLPEGVDGKSFLQSISRVLKALDEQPRDITANLPVITSIAKRLERIFGCAPEIDVTNGNISFPSMGAITVEGDDVKLFVKTVDFTNGFEISPSLDGTFDFAVIVPDQSKKVKTDG